MSREFLRAALLAAVTAAALGAAAQIIQAEVDLDRAAAAASAASVDDSVAS